MNKEYKSTLVSKIYINIVCISIFETKRKKKEEEKNTKQSNENENENKNGVFKCYNKILIILAFQRIFNNDKNKCFVGCIKCYLALAVPFFVCIRRFIHFIKGWPFLRLVPLHYSSQNV